jgi:hypothetical protein
VLIVSPNNHQKQGMVPAPTFAAQQFKIHCPPKAMAPLHRLESLLPAGRFLHSPVTDRTGTIPIDAFDVIIHLDGHS